MSDGKDPAKESKAGLSPLSADEILQNNLRKTGVGKIKRHIFFCAGPKCVPQEMGDQIWSALKAACAPHARGDAPVVIARTKAHCLRLCAKGPVAVVYPEGTWYKEVDAVACERIVKEHLLEGRIVRENQIEI